MTDDQLTVGTAGEDAVLAAILEVIGPHSAEATSLVRIGAGEDDAAVLSPVSGTRMVLTTDTMSEGQDFRRHWWLGPEALAAAVFEPRQEWPMDVGTKAAAQNLSDVNAMGAVPEALLVSLTVPPQIPVAWVQDFYRGTLRACRAPGAEHCVIAGGDLSAGESISVTITAVGALPEGSSGLLRSAARPGDTVAVCGRLGYAAAGLALLEQAGEANVSGAELRLSEAHAETFRQCLQAQRRPHPPLNAGRAAVAAGAVAGMDISDGLLRDAQRLGRSSGVQIQFDDAALAGEAGYLEPVAELLGLAAPSCRDWVLTGGEDYSLLATFPPGAVLPNGFWAIGTVEAVKPGAEPGVVVPAGTGATGWDSLA